MTPEIDDGVRSKLRALGYHLDDLPPTLSTEQASQLLGVSRGALWAAARDEGGIVIGDDLIRPLRVGRAVRWPSSILAQALGLTPAADETTAEPHPRLAPPESESDASAS